MTWRITWSDALDEDIRVASPDLVERAGRAVLAFAERGEGRAYALSVDACVWAFFVPGGRVLVLADLHADELVVLRILPDQPLREIAPLLDEPDDVDDE
jgi:hypothetical protein